LLTCLQRRENNNVTRRMSDKESVEEKRPQPPPKTKAVAIKSRPSKPSGIKGWGRHRVGVGVPVKKEDDSEGLQRTFGAQFCPRSLGVFCLRIGSLGPNSSGKRCKPASCRETNQTEGMGCGRCPHRTVSGKIVCFNGRWAACQHPSRIFNRELF
jgi:hypothetical protein